MVFGLVSKFRFDNSCDRLFIQTRYIFMLPTIQLKVVGLLQAFEVSADWVLFSCLLMIETCAYLFSSNGSPQKRRSRINQQISLIVNQFHVTLHILSPEILFKTLLPCVSLLLCLQFCCECEGVLHLIYFVKKFGAFL